ncbi:hypothetical protein DFQ26_001357 [Actinomortierella ambigua]|nr:hypothetical protein DFQ26_001357 [Actinomortierella ambigua]
MDWFEGQAEMPPCPKDLNRFDYMIDWSSIDFSSEQQELASRERRGRLVAAWSATLTPSSIPGKEEHTTSLSGAEKQSSDSPAALLHEDENEDDESTASHSKRNVAALAWRSLQRPIAHSIVLTKRGMQAQTRNYWWIIAYILVNVVIGLWLGGIFSHPSYTYLGIKSRRGITMIMSVFQPLVYMTVILYRLSKDTRVFDRERAGEYIPFDKIPDHYIWVKYVTVFGEAFKVMSSAFFTDRIFDCPFDTSIGVRDAARCRWYNGNDILDMNGHVPLHYYPGNVSY